jgi:hypothetical protein
MKSQGLYRKLNSKGPGGWECSCCAPPPGQPKKKDKRAARKAFTKLLKKLEEE